MCMNKWQIIIRFSFFEIIISVIPLSIHDGTIQTTKYICELTADCITRYIAYMHSDDDILCIYDKMIDY